MQKFDHKPLQSPNSSIIVKLLTADISCLLPTPYYLPSGTSIHLSFSVLIMAPETPHQIRTPPPNTPKGSSEPATSTMKMGSPQPPGGVAHPACPDQGAPALGQEREVTLSVSSPFIAISNPIPLYYYGNGNVAMC